MARPTGALVVVPALILVSSCSLAAPPSTPTPVPTPTPVELRATEPEHLSGIWRLGGKQELFSPTYGGRYYRWDPDGTVWWAEDADMTGTVFSAEYWFEDGLYFEGESPVCLDAGSYQALLVIEGGRAVRLRLRVVEDGFAIGMCPRRDRYHATFVRVD